jgi:hypothetical protein
MKANERRVLLAMLGSIRGSMPGARKSRPRAPVATTATKWIASRLADGRRPG